MKWDDILNKRVHPPIVPNARESHIDPDYTGLPLDFEEYNNNSPLNNNNNHNNANEMHKKKGRLSTERRFSYYYESTLHSKLAPGDMLYGNGNHHH